MTSKTRPTDQGQDEQDKSRTAQKKKNQAAIRLIEQWLADESGYEEENWPQIEKAINEASAKPWAQSNG